MGYADDADECKRAVEAKLRPESIRFALMFASLLQMIHERLKLVVLDEVREFYSVGCDDSGRCIVNEDAYRRNVLDRAPKNKFRASLLWLVESEAITMAQADRLDDIYVHRHAVTHELIKYIVDPDERLDTGLFVEAVEILKAIKRFWAGIMVYTMIDNPADVDLDQVVSLDMMVLQHCVDAVIEGTRAHASE
ncbi:MULTISPECIES: hypothetical protein [Nocardia]|uniref:hypothetical protein n=1 Tax=Nocardia TaxID=1817 RepID=UPI0024540556|nr:MULTISPECIES: hypothetical protein [Nocardia]